MIGIGDRGDWGWGRWKGVGERGKGGSGGGDVDMDGNLDIINCRIIATACNDNGAIAISSCRSSGSGRRAFFGNFAAAQGRRSSRIRAIPWPR